MQLISNPQSGKSDVRQKINSFLGTSQLENAQDFFEVIEAGR